VEYSMNTEEHDTLKDRLDELDRRLAARKRQLRDSGKIVDVHDTLMTRTRERHAEIRQRIDAALKKGASFDLLKAEFALEINGVVGTLLSWLERLDAETVMKMTKEGSSGARPS
jgi:hypothetical protein